MIQSILPKDSIINTWVDSLSITENPISYQIVCGLSAMGCLLKRNVWVDQLKWKVFPNMSVLLVGPSGIGKDTIINQVHRLLKQFDMVPTIGGRTMENVYKELLPLGNPDFDEPAAAYLAAPELTAFLGGKDYQKSMVQELTDLLSTNDSLDVSIKSDSHKKVIFKPTVTMHAGSTEEWLHKAMPSGSLDGGLFPRFVVVCEEYGSRDVPWVKYQEDTEQIVIAEKATLRFYDELGEILGRFTAKPQEIVPLKDARDMYANWYINRTKYFSKAVRPYANRSRDQLLRIALLCAVSRNHNFMDERDIQFGIDLMNYVAKRIDRAVKPPSSEARIGREILAMLPANTAKIIKALGEHHERKKVLEMIGWLTQDGSITQDANTKEWTLVSNEI